MGAEFVHGLPEETRTLFDLDQELVERQGEYLIADNKGLHVAHEFFQDLRKVLDRLPTEGKDDSSFTDFLKELEPTPTPEETQNLINYVEGYHAADPNRVSTVMLGLSEKEAEESHAVDGAFQLTKGWSPLLERFSSALSPSIRLNSVVNSICYDSNFVQVTASTRSLDHPKITTARAALITVPLGVLKSQAQERGHIQFLPELPLDRKEALGYLEMGQALRVVFRFKKAFWDELKTVPAWSMISDLKPGQALRTWWPNGRLLIGWVGGPESQKFLTLTHEEQMNQGCLMIAQLFDVPLSQVEADLEAVHLHDWKNDEFARGVYSYVLAGGKDAQRILAKPVEGRLFFSGEATHVGGYSATVNGAVLSGIRAAQE
ncbi:MAG: FAD-dependent oxidoreductase, partial [Proteobacteria bacterium]